MSAIAGVYLLDGNSIDGMDLKRMNDRLSHRGPDGSGIWSEGSIGLAHQMLWTTPESLHEKLPLESDGLIITSDSRIDNRAELLPDLGLSDGVSDSEVILEAYRKWNRDCVNKLLGDFAFAIFNRSTKELFCARDHMGVKPFYYYYHPGQIFAFASEIKALFALGVPRQINEIRIGDYLVYEVEDKEITFYQDILRLPTANFMVVGPDGLKKEQYWALDPTREIRLGSDEEYEKAFRDIFTEAVRCRLRSAFPVGSSLSGGLDSSSIVCVARNILSKDNTLKTFSAIYDTVKECDERPYIDAVLADGNLEAHYISGDEFGPLSDIDKKLFHEDQPFFTIYLYQQWALTKKASSQNVRVLLNGLDGDTTISLGQTYITELASKGRLLAMMREAKGLSRNLKISTWGILLDYSIYPFVPRLLVRLWRAAHHTENAGAKIVNLEYAERIGLIDRRNALEEVCSKSAKTAKEQHWRNLVSGLNQLRLEEHDLASAAFSIDSRSPFYDKRLIEFCLAIPPDQKMRNGWTRWIMRSALRDILPEEICHRGGKTGYQPDFFHGLLELDKAIVEDVIYERKSISDNYVNLSELRESYQQMTASEERLNNSDFWFWFRIWQVTLLSLWLHLNPQYRVVQRV